MPLFQECLDEPTTWRYLASLGGLSKTDREAVMALLNKQDTEARQAGKLFGAKGWTHEQIHAAVVQYQADKVRAAEEKTLLQLAIKHAADYPTLNPLVHELVILRGRLKSREAHRGHYGVQWAERNIRQGATVLKKEIRTLNARIVSEARLLNLLDRVGRGNEGAHAG